MCRIYLAENNVKMRGEKTCYLYKYAHPAIIRQKLFEKVDPAIYAELNWESEESDMSDKEGGENQR